MSDWGHESEDLFRSARRGLSPTAGDRERVRARIRAKVAAAAVGAAVTGAAAKAAGATSSAGAAGAAGAAGVGTAGAAGAGVAAKGLSLAFIAKIAVPIVIAGAGLAAAPHVIASRTPVAPLAPAVPATVAQAAPVTSAAPFTPAAPPAPVPVAIEPLPTVATTTTATTSPFAPRAVAPRPAQPVAAAEAARAPSPATARAPSSANEGEEAALVGAIDAALRSGDSAGALRLAADHQRRFPQGVLSEEREGARVVARCMASRSPSASDAASAFLASHPRSPMRARIAATCGTGDSK